MAFDTEVEKSFDLAHFGFVIVSKEVAEKGLPIGFISREDPLDLQDSGWAFLTGNETDEFCENPENFVVWDIRNVLKLDPSIALYLDCEAGTCIFLPKAAKKRETLTHFVTDQNQGIPS